MIRTTTVALIATLAVTVAACGRSSSSTPIKPGKASGEISVWAWGNEVEILGEMTKQFEAENPGSAIDVLVWNGTPDQSKAAGDPLLDREITITGLPAGHAVLARVAEAHWNIAGAWYAERGWPNETELAELRAADRLHLEDLGRIDGAVTLTLPMPGTVHLRVT